MSKKLRKPLSWLLALCMILSLLPMSVFAAGNTQGSLIAFEYDNGGTDLSQGSLTIIVQNESGQKLDEITVKDYYKTWAAQDKIRLINDEYTIISLSLKDGDWGTVLSVNNIDGRSCTFSLTYTVDHETLILTVREFDGPEVDEEINHGELIEYRIYDAQLLKMLYAAGNHDVSIDTKIDRVEMEFVRDYASGSDIKLEHISPAANQLGYYFTSLSNASGNGNPYNIKELTVTFDNGRKATIPAKNLFYHKAGSSLYEIKDNAMADLCVVTFYTQPGVLVEYHPYAIRFVEAGKSIQSAGVSMPKTPEYGGSYIFVNWSYDQNGERPFLKSDVIEQDTDVFARRTSSTAGGTEIHVMNQNDSLINRFLELYNAQNNTQATKSDITLDSVQITVYGQNDEHTNPDYDNGATECGWRDDNGYFFVVNYDAEHGLPNLTNTHIPHNEMTKIVMTANVNGQNAQVEIPVGDGAGELSVNLNSDELEYIVQLIVNEAPDAPDDNDLIGDPETPDDGILGSITVECTTEKATHVNKSKEYGALAGSYDVGEVTAQADGGYTCDVTVFPNEYVSAFIEDNNNVNHTTEDAPKTITLTWDGKWVAPADALPVVFEVTCDPTAPDPTKPDEEDIPDILGAGGAVLIECNNIADHSKSYDLWPDTDGKNRYEVADPVKGADGTWTCDVTILPTVYVAQFGIDHGNVTHWLDPKDQTGETITLTWDAEKGWTAPAKTEPYRAKFTVSCVPDKPTDDEIIEALDQNKSILVDCINEASGHTDATFTLWKNSTEPAAERYTVGVPTYDETDGAWTCVVTILPGVYVERYSDDDHTGVAHWLADDTPQEVTLILNDGEWVSTLANGARCATFKVLCAPSQGELAALLNGKITVDCTTVDAHENAVYGLIANGYTLPAGVTGTATTGFQYVVTIVASAYADHYSKATRYGVHTASAADPTITLTWDTTENQWTVAGGVTIPVTCTPGYTLTYDANGGAFADGQPTNTVSNIQPNTNYSLDEQKPTKSGAVFVGWTTTDTNEAVYGAGDKLPDVVDKVKVTGPTTVYAVWGADTNDDGIADAQQIIITPADITVYTGGTGYDGVVNGANNHGIPEPGYYFTLPYELNQTLQQMTGSQVGPVNLANHIRLTDRTDSSRQWILQLYDGTTNSAAYGKYIYRLAETATGNSPAKLVIKDGSTIITDDELYITNDALYKTYTMSLDTGAAAAGNITVEISADGNSWSQPAAGAVNGLCLGEGTLTVRGENTTTSSVTTNVVTTPNDISGTDADIVAVADTDTSYKINSSDVSVTNGHIALFTDDLLPNTVLSGYLDDQGLIGENTKVDYQYLDLVDTNNGNAYVTANEDLDIYWKLPENADPDGNFQVVHFTGLDRNYDVERELEGLVNDGTVEVKNNVTVETINGEQYLKFTTSSFSPFALVYDTKDEEPIPETVTVAFESGKHGALDEYRVDSKYVEVVKGERVNRSDIPTVYPDKGYEFIGWYKLGDPGHLYTDYQVSRMTITERTTFIAQYRLEGSGDTGDTGDVDDEYDVIYNANYTGGSYPRRMGSYDAGEKVTVSENKWFERDGYVFVGWNTEADGTGDSYAPDDTFRMPDSDVYLYAQWQKEKPGPDDTGVSDWLETDEHNAYLTGYPDSTFRPDRNMTRAEVAQMFYALLKNKNVTVTASFSDVPAGAWYATAVNTMASLGMMDGYPDGTFHPDAPITRAEFATVALAFAYDPARASCSYTDVSVGAWYYTYVAQATTYGWIGGYYDGSFRPNNPITRTEVCVIVNNMLGRTPDKSYINRNEDELVDFADLSSSYWGYYTIMEATNDHEYTGNYISETWTDVN